MSAVIENRNGYFVLVREGSTEKIWALTPSSSLDNKQCPKDLEPLTTEELTVSDQQLEADGFVLVERTPTPEQFISGKAPCKMQLKYGEWFLYLYKGQEDLSPPFERANENMRDSTAAVSILLAGSRAIRCC